jgi:hypothetical protein
VLLEGAALPSEDELPEPLQPLTKRQTIVLSAENYAAELDQFVSRIEQGLVQDLVQRQREAGAPSLHIGVPEPA